MSKKHLVVRHKKTGIIFVVLKIIPEGPNNVLRFVLMNPFGNFSERNAEDFVYQETLPIEHFWEVASKELGD